MNLRRVARSTEIKKNNIFFDKAGDIRFHAFTSNPVLAQLMCQPCVSNSPALMLIILSNAGRSSFDAANLLKSKARFSGFNYLIKNGASNLL